MLELENFKKAAETVKNVTVETKLIYSDFLSEKFGNEIYLKPENMQTTGAYKVRGAYNKIMCLPKEERDKGVIAASAGNHALGVAYAAAKIGIPATIVMPSATPLIKVNRARNYGAEIVLFGDCFEDADEYAREIAKKDGRPYIHPFNDEDVAAGVGTVALEILEELPDADYILVPIGGGGLCAGVATAAKLINPDIKIVGVEPAGANCIEMSLEKGEPTALEFTSTIADGAAVKKPGEKLFPYVKENLDELIIVEDDQLIVSFLDMVENHKMILENAGLLSIAALDQLDCEGKKIVSILSGGNMDVITMSSVVQQGLIFRDRIFTVSVLLPDKPGMLAKVSETIADVQGNVIKLEHNQFVSTNRNAAVELRITLEAFGTEHKNRILTALDEGGYRPKVVRTSL